MLNQILGTKYSFSVVWLRTSLRPTGKDVPIGIVLWDTAAEVLLVLVPRVQDADGFSGVGRHILDDVRAVFMKQLEELSVGQDPIGKLRAANVWNLFLGPAETRQSRHSIRELAADLYAERVTGERRVTTDPGGHHGRPFKASPPELVQQLHLSVA